ncbi:hypothetical protein DPMN_068479 [Dreissena polymorpha]|uniref:Uncharacterized protein n=2 Tax=Dreissena polymorpha TaxID=45954 RepID=A0A9D3Z2K6_DREPO|nr:hypothetical protein DPMN_068479 [Dreissena polymorpha]
MYCLDHSQLCCFRCIELNHSLCLQVTILPKAATGKSTDFKNLSVRMENSLSQMKHFQTYMKDILRSLKVSYNEHERLIVDGMRLNIISFLLQCETGTVNTTHEHMQYTVNEMREKIKYLLADFEKSTIKEKKEELSLNLAPLKGVRNSSIRLHDDLSHLHTAIPKVLGRPELSFIASKICQAKIQQSDTLLKENFPNYVFTACGKSEHNVRIPSDSHTCWVRAICVLPNGQVLVADYYNKKVKLLNQQNQVMSHCVMSAGPKAICQITPNEVAVAVDDNTTHEVQFIKVDQSQFVRGRKFQLQHRCYGIAHYHGDLFIVSGQALFKYSLSGKQVCRLYEDLSGLMTVYTCAVSPTLDKLYITNLSSDKLLTLARDGTLLASFTDPELELPCCVHVTPVGQVLVCGRLSLTLVQVDSVGRTKLATMTTEMDAVWAPKSVCYSSTTSSIIVGMEGNHILVFKVE